MRFIWKADFEKSAFKATVCVFETNQMCHVSFSYSFKFDRLQKMQIFFVGKCLKISQKLPPPPQKKMIENILRYVKEQKSQKSTDELFFIIKIC